MKLACADFAWPLLSHDRVCRLISLLEIPAVDLGIFATGTHLKPETIRRDIPFWAGTIAERLAGAGLAVADVFIQPATDFASLAVNTPDAAQRDEAEAFFRDMLEFAKRIGAVGMTMLPGVRFDDEPWETSIRRSAEALRGRVELAQRAGLSLSVEGHLGSNVDSPEKVAQLLSLTPGLSLTLDYGHFVYQGYADAEIEPLLAQARHFHCRGGARGRLQTRFEHNTIDFARIVARMREIHYPGYLAIEYTWQDWQGCNETENICETIRFRDFLRALDGVS